MDDLYVFIGGVREATEALETTKFDVAVSLADPDEPKRPVNLGLVPRTLKLDFHDRVLPKEGKVLASVDQARSLVSFLDEARGDGCQRFLFHCYAGQSRSTAAALALLWRHYGANRLADRLLEVRPMALPNRHLALLLEDALGLNNNRVLSDAIDVIESRSQAPLQLLRLAQEE